MSIADEKDSMEAPAKAPVKPRWRRRMKIAAIAIVLLAVALRVVMVFALPAVLSRVASYYDLDIRCQRQSLAVLSGHMGLWGVKVFPRGGGDPLFVADYVHGEIVPWKLLTGKLHVLRAEADGVDLTIQRTRDGRLPLLEKLAARSTTQPTVQNPQNTSLDFTSPLILEALRLNNVSAHLRDDAISPNLDTHLDMDLRINHLGAPQGTPIEFEIDAYADKVLDSLRVEGQATGSGPNLDGNAKVTLRGLHPGPLAGYLAAMGLKPAADSIAMEAAATMKARAVPGSKALALNASLDHVRFTADDQDFATVSSIHLDADEVDPTGAKIASLAIEGGRFRIWRDATGALHVAGLSLVPMTAGASTSGRFPLSVRELNLHDLQYAFHDASVSPAVDITAKVDDVTLKPRPKSNTADLKGTIEIPGVARAVHLDGVIESAARRESASVSLSIDGIRPDALRPYLAAMGIESQLRDADFAAAMQWQHSIDPKGTPSTNVKLTDLRLSDQSELLVMNQIDLAGARLDPVSGRLHLDALDIVGPSLSVERMPDGSFAALGLGIHPRPSTQPTAVLPMPRVEVGRFSWKGVKIGLTDRTTPVPTRLSIDDAGVEVKDLLLDLSSHAVAEKTGAVHAWVHSPQLAPGSIDISGALTPGPGSIAADLKIDGQHLRTAALAPYLSPLGIEPVLRDATLALHAKLGAIGGYDRAITSWLDVSDATLNQGNEELLGVDTLSVDSMTFKAGECDLGKIIIRNPRARATRDAKGAVTAAGLKLFRLPKTHRQGTDTEISKNAFATTLKQLSLDNAQLHWNDAAVTPAVTTTAYVTAALKDLTLGRHASPATFSLQLSCEGIVEKLSVDGEQLDPTPGAELVKMSVAADGVRGSAINGYLPAGIKSDVADGKLRAEVLASRLHGVRSAYVDLMMLDWRDGEHKPLLSADLARLAASNLNFAGDEVRVEEVSLSNFVSGATIDPQGALHVAGLKFSSQPATGTVIKRQPVAVGPGDHPSPLYDTEPDETDLDARLASDLIQPLPLMVLDKLDLDVRKFTLHDQRRPDAAPLQVADLRIRNTAPITLGGAYPETQPPAHFEITGTIAPLVRQFTLDIDAKPLAPEPSAMIELSASGIRGEGVTELFPRFAGRIDGSGMVDGRFHASARVRARLQRRGPRDFGLNRPFDLDVSVNDVTFRDREIGRVLAGVEQVNAEEIHVDPSKQSVRIKTLEISTPIGFAMRDVDGVHAMGMLFKLSRSPTISTIAVASSNEFRLPGDVQIDRMLINGIDLRLEDNAVDPPLVVPLKSLDVEVRDLSTSALREDRPIRYNAILESGKVDLPKRSTTEPSSQATESRELFSQITSSGAVSLYPAIHGYTRTSLNGVDLAAFKGEAGAAGVDLNSGILDADISTRFRVTGDMDLRSRFVLTDLHLTEPEHGPIQTHLGLSAPLDVVLPALRDPDGAITIPLNVPLEKGKISFGDAFGAATGAMAQIMMTAVASAPVKAAGGVSDLLNLSPQKSGEPSIVRVPFKSGDVTLSPHVRKQLDAVIRRLKQDENAQVTLKGEMSEQDQSIAYERANPPPADCKALAEKLRAERADLSAHRTELAARATAELASSALSAQVTIEQLKDLDEKISQTDDAMDRLYDMLRPGAELQASRRARATALEISNQRLGTVESTLLAANIPHAADRIHRIAATDKPTNPGDSGAVVLKLVQRKRDK